MNSDPTQPATPSANSPAASNRPSNLKSRWKRAPSAGVPAQRPAASTASFGLVTDLSSVRESLSGQHAKGYAPSEPPAAPTPAPVSAPAPRPEPPRAAVPPPSRPREFSSPAPRERDAAPAQRRETPPPYRPSSDNRGGQREQYVALKPDPANEPAPRRLRTEASRPVPVQEYAPSSFARSPDKSIPVKSNREPSRHEAGRSSAKPAAAVRPHASISLHPKSSKEEVRPKKSRGIVGFIKRIFSGGLPVGEEEEKKESSSRERDKRESEGDGRHERRHGKSSHHRHSRGDRDRAGRS